MIAGEIEQYLGALGMRPDDPALTPVLDLPGPTTDTNEEREADGNIVFHLAARSNGTEFLFTQMRLAAVFIGTQHREAWGIHPRTDQLIDGLSGTATRDEARALLGEPAWSNDTDDRWPAGTNWLQLHYNADRIQIIIAAIGDDD